MCQGRDLKDSHNEVAIKSIPQSGRTLSADFEREAQHLMRLRHAGLCGLKDYFVEDGWLYLVMEYIHGETLGYRLKPPFPLMQVLAWADRWLDVLDYLHQEGITHGSIRPHKIALTPEGQIILLGLANSRLSPYAFGDGYDGLRYFGVYTLPEQLENKPIDERSDLYMLGATLYELLTAQRPANAVERYKHMEQGFSDLLLPANEVNPQVPPDVAQVLQQVLAFDPSQRPNSVAQMRAMLKIQPTPLVAQPVRPVPSEADNKRMWLWAIAVLLLVGVLVAALIIGVDP